MTKFQGLGIVIAELENGQEIKCKTMLETNGKIWQEDMHPDNLGYYQTFIEVNESQIEAKYPDEYGIDDIVFQNINIKSIKQILSDVDWGVIE